MKLNATTVSAAAFTGLCLIFAHNGGYGKRQDFRDAPSSNRAIGQLDEAPPSQVKDPPSPVNAEDGRTASLEADLLALNKVPRKKLRFTEEAMPPGQEILETDHAAVKPQAPYGKYRLVATDIHCIVARLVSPTPPVNVILSGLRANGLAAGECTGLDRCIVGFSDKKGHGKTSDYFGSLNFVASLLKRENIILVQLTPQLPPLNLVQRQFSGAGIKFIPFKYNGAAYAAAVPNGADIKQMISLLARQDYVAWIGLNEDDRAALLR